MMQFASISRHIFALSFPPSIMFPDWSLVADIKGDWVDIPAHYNKFKEYYEVECPLCSQVIRVGNSLHQDHSRFDSHYKSKTCQNRIKQKSRRDPSIPGTSIIELSGVCCIT